MIRRVGACAIAGIVAASCGASTSDTTTAAESSTPPTTATAASTTAEASGDADASGRYPLPNTNVLDVGTGSEINMSSIGGDKPILLWFYAPH